MPVYGSIATPLLKLVIIIPMSLTIVELTCVITVLGSKRTSCHSELFQFQIYFKTKVVSGMTVTQIDRSQLDLDHVY